MHKLLVLAGALALLSVPALAATPTCSSGQRMLKYDPNPTAHTATQVGAHAAGQRMLKYDPNPTAHAPTNVAASCHSAGQRMLKYDPNPS